MSNYITDPAVELGRTSHDDHARLMGFLGTGHFNATCMPRSDSGLDIVEQLPGSIYLETKVIPHKIIGTFMKLAIPWLLPGRPIDVTYQRSLVQPGRIQRGNTLSNRWHFDGFSEGIRTVTFSNILTTLVATGEIDLNDQYGRHLYNDKKVEDAIQAGILKLMPSFPVGTALGMTGATLHAGQINTFSVPIMRGFMRLTTE